MVKGSQFEYDSGMALDNQAGRKTVRAGCSALRNMPVIRTVFLITNTALMKKSIQLLWFLILFALEKKSYDMPQIGCGIHALQWSAISRIGRHSAGYQFIVNRHRRCSLDSA